MSEILNDYRLWDRMVKAKLHEIDRLRTRMTSIKAIKGEPAGGQPYTLEDYAADLELLEKDVEELILRREQALGEILKLISGLDPVKFDVMYRRYVCLQSFHKIARDTNVSRSTIRSRHDSALKIVNYT